MIVISTVNGEATCAVTAMFPCHGYVNWSNELKILKAVMIIFEQIETPMTFFSHGGFINHHVCEFSLRKILVEKLGPHSGGDKRVSFLWYSRKKTVRVRPRGRPVHLIRLYIVY